MANIVIKLGGSVLTAKEDDEDFPKNIVEAMDMSSYKIKRDNIMALSEQIQRFRQNKPGKNEQIVLITGAGCYGHPQAKSGVPVQDVHHIVKYLNDFTKNVMEFYGMGGKVFSPMDFGAKCNASDSKLGGLEFDLEKLWKTADAYTYRGLIIYTHGDAVPMADGKKGRLGDYEVIGGDDLASNIAKLWPADKVIMVSDVKGVYQRFPHNPADKPIRQIVADVEVKTEREFRELMASKYGVEFGESKDMTGGLFGKAWKLYALTQKTGITSQIVDIENLEAALSGENVGTTIEKSI